MRTREQAIKNVAQIWVAGAVAAVQRTPREQAEAAWTPTCGLSVDDLEDQIRLDRGLPPKNLAESA